MNVKVPTLVTLKKYGLSMLDWERLVAIQGGVCAVCETLPSTGRLCIDHEHVKGWKKLPAEERAKAVRGLLCWRCNHYFVGRGITIDRSRAVTRYLLAHHVRKELAKEGVDVYNR